MAIVLNGKYFDIYVNGYLRKRHEFKSMVKQNFGDLWVNLYGIKLKILYIFYY